MRIRHLIVIGLLGAAMAVGPIAVEAADASVVQQATPNPNSQKVCKDKKGKGPKYPPKKCEMSVSASQMRRGNAYTTSGEGFGGSVEGTMGGIHLFTVQSDPDGNVIDQQFIVPCNVAPGQQQVQLTGADVDGAQQVLTATVTVTNEPCVLGEQVSRGSEQGQQSASGSTTGGSTLPFTGGAATTLLLTLAVGLIAAGAVALSAARRRRSAA